MSCPDCGADERSQHDVLCASSVEAMLSATRAMLAAAMPLAKAWLRIGHALLADGVLARRERRRRDGTEGA